MWLRYLFILTIPTITAAIEASDTTNSAMKTYGFHQNETTDIMSINDDIIRKNGVINLFFLPFPNLYTYFSEASLLRRQTSIIIGSIMGLRLVLS